MLRASAAIGTSSPRYMVAVARNGEAPVSQIAKGLRDLRVVSAPWMNLADIEDGVRPGVTVSESTELRKTKRLVRVLEQEVEILRRAAAYFAKDISPQ